MKNGERKKKGRNRKLLSPFYLGGIFSSSCAGFFVFCIEILFVEFLILICHDLEAHVAK